jgi:hypothetical protein
MKLWKMEYLKGKSENGLPAVTGLAFDWIGWQ